VELVRRYSNRSDLQERLDKAHHIAHERRGPSQGSDGDFVSGGASDVWRLSDRLSEEDVEEIILLFLAGTPKRVLAEQFGASLSSIKALVRQHGVRRTS
jgi:hypothetical protein